MKKILSILALIMALVFSQSAKAQTADVKFGETESFRSWPYKLTKDTINGTSEVSKTFLVGKDYKYTYQYEVSADSLHRAGKVNIFLEGSFNGIKYYPIDTTVWGMSEADTSFIFDSGATYVKYRFLRTRMKGLNAGTRARLGNQSLTVSK